MFARVFAVLLASGFLVLSGCGPAILDETRSWNMDAAETQSLGMDAQSKPQTITVECESTSANVTVGLFKESDAKDLNSIQFSKALKSESATKKGSFAVDVPEKTATRVVVESSGKTTVNLHVTNKK